MTSLEHFSKGNKVSTANFVKVLINLRYLIMSMCVLVVTGETRYFCHFSGNRDVSKVSNVYSVLRTLRNFITTCYTVILLYFYPNRSRT